MFVKVSETYDLSTKQNKMGLLGIHTPEGKLVYSLWPGFFQNYRKFRFVSCDVALACASMLPADPLQIGQEAGDIAPQDMFNPILYKAVSNDSMSNLLNRIYGGGHNPNSTWVGKGSVTDANDEIFTYNANQDVDQFAMYYGLLSDTGGWRKAMPQAGLSLRGLKPITFSLLATQGQPNVSGALGPDSDFEYTDGDGNPQTFGIHGSNALLYPGTGEYSANSNIDCGWSPKGRFMRGPSQRMPAMDTYVLNRDGTFKNTLYASRNIADNSDCQPTAASSPLTVPIVDDLGNNDLVIPNVDSPDCFVAAIVLPPAKLNRLYYRLKVTWTVEFIGPRPVTDLTNWYGLALAGVQSYGSDYLVQGALINKATKATKTAMVDAGDAELTKVMESAS